MNTPNTSKAELRAARAAKNRAEYAALSATYAALPKEARELISSEFATRRAIDPTVSWARFLAVALPLLPADAQ